VLPPLCGRASCKTPPTRCQQAGPALAHRSRGLRRLPRAATCRADAGAGQPYHPRGRSAPDVRGAAVRPCLPREGHHRGPRQIIALNITGDMLDLQNLYLEVSDHKRQTEASERSVKHWLAAEHGPDSVFFTSAVIRAFVLGAMERHVPGRQSTQPGRSEYLAIMAGDHSGAVEQGLQGRNDRINDPHRD